MLYRVIDEGPFQSPVLLVALDGWVNAGSAGTLAAELIAGEGTPVVTFDSDQIYDYRVVRPIVDFEEGVLVRLSWPELAMRRNRVRDRDLLVVVGTEPNWQWQGLAAAVADLAERFGVVEEVSIGGIPWAVPHTRPLSLMTTSTSPGRIPSGEEPPEGLLRVPGAAVSAIEYVVAGRGIPTIGFWARVPNYVGTNFPAAAVALTERVSRHLGIEFDPAALRDEAGEQRLHLDQIAEARPEVKAMIEGLEQMVDTQQAMSGEDLAAEIERFLREQGR